MKRYCDAKKVLVASMIAIVGALTVVSLQEVTVARAAATTASVGCDDDTCDAQEDCGPNCYCNRPSRNCRKNDN